MSYIDPPQNYDDPHRLRSDAHYRLYQGSTGPTVICLQDFDYLDYDGTKFLSSEAWHNAADAADALVEYLGRDTHQGKLMLRAVAAEDLKAGDVVDVVQNPKAGTLTVVKYRQPFD